MPYTLDNFSNQVPPALLRQAQAHVAAGQVHNLEHLGIEWVADVGAGTEGDEAHSVSVAVGPRGELLATCTCDDEENDLCRHAVATLLAAVKQEPTAVANAKPAKPAAKTARKPAKTTASGRLRAALEATPHAALVDLVMNLSKGDKLMQNQIMLEITDVGASTESYRASVKAALSPRGGISAWYQPRVVRAIAKQVDALIDRAEQAISQGDVDKAVPMALVVLEEVQITFAKVGSDADVDECADRAGEIVALNYGRLSEVTRGEVVQSLLHIVQGANRREPRSIELCKILVEMVETPPVRSLVAPLLAPPPRDYYPFNYDEGWDDHANLYIGLQHRLIERLDGPAAAEEFARRNLRFYLMRNRLMEDAAKRKEWAIVKPLATEGLRLADQQRHSLAQYYRKQIISAADARGNEESEQLLTDLLIRQRVEDYALWKASVPPNLWPTARANLFATGALRNDAAYAILVQEEAWDEMMAWALRNVMSPREVNFVLEKSGAELSGRFPDDVAKWCARVMEVMLDKYSANRNDYRNVAELLQRLKALGLEAQAKAQADLLREVYYSRPALLEELKNV